MYMMVNNISIAQLNKFFLLSTIFTATYTLL
jgi:hypothetical protein